jgi:hypothetical protein
MFLGGLYTITGDNGKLPYTYNVKESMACFRGERGQHIDIAVGERIFARFNYSKFLTFKIPT